MCTHTRTHIKFLQVHTPLDVLRDAQGNMQSHRRVHALQCRHVNGWQSIFFF